MSVNKNAPMDGLWLLSIMAQKENNNESKDVPDATNIPILM